MVCANKWTTFDFLLVMQCKVFEELIIVSTFLQSKDDDLGKHGLLKTAADETGAALARRSGGPDLPHPVTDDP